LQFCGPALQKLGAALRVTSAGVTPRILYDADAARYTVIWLDRQQTALMSASVESDGAIGAAHVVTESSKTLSELTASILPKSRRIVALALVEETTEAAARNSLVGWIIGSKTRLVFQPASVGLRSAGSAAFAGDGFGFAAWSFGTALKFRKISAAGSFAAPPKAMAAAADESSVNPAVVFDEIAEQFVAVWAAGKEMRAAAWGPAGTVRAQPFRIADSPGSNPAASYDPQQGNVLAVWQDDSRIRASLFFPGAANAKTVVVGDNFFTPKNLTVPVGAIVTWTNVGFNPHTVTSGTPVSQVGLVFDSGTMNRGARFTFRFTKTGNVPYFCRVHGVTQSGVINVAGK
jgi:plastocyanin